jgi:acyl-[acyl-carrier-protein]-phospholipid O-acyltransferase / long-chain-fatty-acid--[acyl-carrier-protein] ligase
MINSSRFNQFRKTHSIILMNLAQLGAIINDNIYKLSMVFLLIDVLGHQEASTILAKAGAIFVIPFLLFSSAAGIFADRFSKKWVLSVMKIVETTVFLIAIPIFLWQSSFGCYFLLFILATHSAVFGPSKYGIIPELVRAEAVPKANSLITSTTYLGIIVGTFLASFLSNITGKRYVLVMIFCLVLAILGLLSALAIQQTPRQGSSKKPSPLFFLEIYRTLIFCKEIRHLQAVLIGSSFFLFIGAYTQLAIIPYTIESLHLDDTIGGYLFLCTALGIALGAYLSGKILKKAIDLAIPCLASFAIAILFLSLFAFSSHVSLVITSLFLLGIAGGLFVVPLDSFTQLSCPNEKRGQIIAAGNFLGFIGVLAASFFLYFCGTFMKISPASSFGIMGILTILFCLGFSLRLSDYIIHFFSRKLASKPASLQNEVLFFEADKRPLLILQHGTWKKLLYLSRLAPEYHFLLSQTTHWLYRLLASFSYHFHLSQPSPNDLLEKAESLQKQGIPVCILIPNRLWMGENEDRAPVFALFKQRWRDYLMVDIQLPLSARQSTTITFSRK